MRPLYQWNIGARSLELGQRTLIMGIVNVTPDSFSDGGEFLDRARAVEHALRLLDQGADIVDIGGESTRPGAHVLTTASQKSELNSAASARNASAVPVTVEEELRRVIPVIGELKRTRPDAVISVDTYKSEVARAAVKSGAEIVNDVSGFRWDPAMISTLAGLPCGAVLMHMRGLPEQWRSLPPAENVVQLVNTELKQWAAAATESGVERQRIVLDPGFGFGKSFDQNYPLIAHFGEFHAAGFPLLVGTSRKSFIGRTLGGESKVAPSERLFGTLASETALVLKGAHIIRTHDVQASLQAARVADAILHAN